MGLRALELELMGTGLGGRPAPRTEISLIPPNSSLTGLWPDRICEGWGEDSCKHIITNNQQL